MLKRIGTAVAVMLAAQACTSQPEPCPALLCPAEYVGITLTVSSSQGSGAITGVQVAFSGPSAGTMTCGTQGADTVCTWPPADTVTEGTYTLQVSAPGYQTATVSSDVAVTPGMKCGCPSASLTPSDVTLTPM